MRMEKKKRRLLLSALCLAVAALSGALLPPAASAAGGVGRKRRWAGFDYYVLALQWPGTVCRQTSNCCSSNGCCRSHPPKFFTIHGLWPQYSYGGWPSCCRPTTFNSNKISRLKTILEEYWPSLYCGSFSTCFSGKTQFWAHEDEYDYFSTALYLYGKYNVTKALRKAHIYPRGGRKYLVGHIVSAIEFSFGAMPSIVCKNGSVQELRLCFHKDYQPRDCVIEGENSAYRRNHCPRYVTLPSYKPHAIGNSTEGISNEVNVERQSYDQSQKRKTTTPAAMETTTRSPPLEICALLLLVVAGDLVGAAAARHGGAVGRKQREFDYFALSLQWPGTICASTRHCCAVNGCCRSEPLHTFTIHGLWPDYDDGTWPACCRHTSFDMDKILPLKPTLDKYWPSLYCSSSSTCFSGKGPFWAHEKHGTCSSPVVKDELEYFSTALDLYFKYNVTEMLASGGIQVSNGKEYALTDVIDAIKCAFGASPQIVCKKGSVEELRLCFDKDLKKKYCPRYITLPTYDPIVLANSTRDIMTEVESEVFGYLYTS
uniref:Uncharacterized protein n=1 Tax=Leersia perrieri TaxID=77586 RepID=A0A0D9V902_9ORYZ